jgi:hypothetical protein
VAVARQHPTGLGLESPPPTCDLCFQGGLTGWADLTGSHLAQCFWIPPKKASGILRDTGSQCNLGSLPHSSMVWASAYAHFHKGALRFGLFLLCKCVLVCVKCDQLEPFWTAFFATVTIRTDTRELSFIVFESTPRFGARFFTASAQLQTTSGAHSQEQVEPTVGEVAVPTTLKQQPTKPAQKTSTVFCVWVPPLLLSPVNALSWADSWSSPCDRARRS